MEEKVCSKCNISQPKENFYKHKRFKDGLKSECKTCYKQRYEKISQDPDHIAKRRERYKNRTQEQIDLHKLKKRAKKRNLTLEEIIEEDRIVSEAEKLNMKYCYTCQRTLDKSCFSKMKISKDGLNTACKECRSKIVHDYYTNNVEDITEKKIIYRKNNWDYILKRQGKYMKNRRQQDDMYRLVTNIRNRVKKYMRAKGMMSRISKSNYDMIGCTPQELREHIESKFIDGMSWDNYGFTGWHLDHIIPLASANTKEEIIKLNHYTNLQPLWAIDNMKKGGRTVYPDNIL